MGKIIKFTPKLTEKENFSVVRREAIYTGVALALLIIFWLIAGFGLMSVDVKIFHLPLWAVAGSVGVWIFAILASYILSHKLFKDIYLGGDDDDK